MPHLIEHISSARTPYGRKIRHVLLHSRWLHIVLLILLIVDALICMISGVLESHFWQGTAEDLSKYICNKNTNTDGTGTPKFGCRPPPAHHRRLAASQGLDASPWLNIEEDGGAEQRYLGSSDTRSESKCVDDIKHDYSFGNHDLHTAEITLAKVSCAILVFFLIEQLTLMTELGREYCKPMFVLDITVIVSSLTVELLIITNALGVGASTGLLIVARVWRFARVGHGVLASSEQVDEIIEEDDSIESMTKAWEMLPDERWKEIRKHLTDAELEGQLSPEELQLAQQLGKSPAVALRCLAFARSYKKLHDEKKKNKDAAPGEKPIGQQSVNVEINEVEA